MIENVSTQLTVFHCFAHCLLPGRAFASLYVLLFLEKEAEIGGRDFCLAKSGRDEGNPTMWRPVTLSTNKYLLINRYFM